MDNPFNSFPKKRIRPYDGMAITADVWDSEHTYHRQVMNSQRLLFHGYGILAGLDVLAGDPPGSIVYVLPGVAVDRSGRLIVLAEPVAYDVGAEAEGPLYLVISYRENVPAAPEDNQLGDPIYVQEQFLITARSRPTPDASSVELARFNRSSRGAALQAAARPDFPQKNEIDLRFRPLIRMQTEQQLTAAVVYLGNIKEKIQGQGLVRMAKEIRQYSSFRLIVEDDLPLGPGILSYSLIYIVAEGNVKVSAAQVKGLQSYLERGGTLLVDALDAEAFAQFRQLAGEMGQTLRQPTPEDVLLAEPFIFHAAPSAVHKDPALLLGNGFVLSDGDYGAFWAGKVGSTSPSRAAIRATMEWGANLLNYAAERRS